MKPTTEAMERADLGAPSDLHRLLDMVHTGWGDPLPVVRRALRADPSFGEGHCMHAALLVLACREDARLDLERALPAAWALEDRMDQRQRRHIAAATAWARRDLRGSLEQYGGIAADHPTDTLALRLAQFGDLMWGRRDTLRDRIASALPHWHEDQPGYANMLAMYAFGLAEAGDHRRAEDVGRKSLALNPWHAGAVHAVAHALEMQGRATDGIAWLNATAQIWTGNPSYAAHVWWHLAMYHLDLDHNTAALSIHDRQLSKPRYSGVGQLVDASSLLWRLELAGHDVRDRWEGLADRWAALPLGGLRPFNDTHAVLAYVASGRTADARRLMSDLRACAARSRELDAIIREGVLPVCEALIDFGAGRHEAAASSLDRLRHVALRCGGSLAQCDLLHVTLVECALRGRQTSLARRLIEERLATRPSSRFNQRLRLRLGHFAGWPAVLTSGVAVSPFKPHSRRDTVEAH